MRLIPKNLIVATIAASFATTFTTQTSHAGQWLDSIFGRRQPVYPVGQPIPLNGQVAAYSPGAYPSSGYVPPSYANLRSPQVLGFGNYATPPANNAPLLAPGFPQTVAAQLPTAAYDTQWSRTPVTYYRPVTAFDPRYGTTVTSLQPCTSYQYNALRQPVIAPRPLLGEYGLQANRFPSITGPGYNPTGLANYNPTGPANYNSAGLVNTAMMPAWPQAQTIPNAGAPIGNQPGSFAPVGGAGISSGMPTSTLPLTTMSYNPAFATSAVSTPQFAGQAYTGQQAFYPNYNGQVVANPAYATSYTNSPSMGYQMSATGTAIGTGVIPTAAWLPSSTNCVNGQCYPQAGQITPPNFPGAVSVSPVGPPVYSTTPNAPNGNGSYVQPNNPNSGLNPAGAAGYANPYAPVMPNMPILPPGASLNDPDAMKQPSLDGRSASGPSATKSAATKSMESPFIVPSIPMVAIDRESAKKSQETLPNVSNRDESSKTNDSIASNIRPSIEATPSVPNLLDNPPEIPQTLSPRSNYGMKPLSAPDDFDGKPRWNPTLLDPEDRTVMERAGRISPVRPNTNNRIRLQEDPVSAVSAVALATKGPNRSAIQLISGVEPIKSEPADTAESSAIRFRPVTSLK